MALALPLASYKSVENAKAWHYLLHGNEARESLSVLITRANAGTDHTGSHHADIGSRGDVEEPVEDIVTTGHDNASPMFQVGGDVRVEEGRLDLVGNEEKENIRNRGGLGKVILDRERCFGGRLGISILTIRNQDIADAGVSKILRLSGALVSETEEDDLFAVEDRNIGVVIVIDIGFGRHVVM